MHKIFFNLFITEPWDVQCDISVINRQQQKRKKWREIEGKTEIYTNINYSTSIQSCVLYFCLIYHHFVSSSIPNPYPCENFLTV